MKEGFETIMLFFLNLYSRTKTKINYFFLSIVCAKKKKIRNSYKNVFRDL